MEILIDGNKTVGDIQKEFNSQFPFLKIEFFNGAYDSERAPDYSNLISPGKKILECRQVQTNGALFVGELQTVAQIESLFWNRFNLSVHVFRKSDNLWIETSLTHAWTLKQQNEEGMEFTNRV